MDALINVNGENFQTLQILLLTTLITLLPSIVVMMTSFTRYIISLSFPVSYTHLTLPTTSRV